MAQRTVLLVDGDVDSRTIYHAILLHHGYDVWQAADAEEGWRLVEELRPDLLILEFPVFLPDGQTLTERVKRDPSTAAVVVLTITTRAMRDDLDRALAAGSDACLTKPVRPQDVVAEVRRLIGPGLVTTSV